LISYVLPGRDRKSCKNKFKAEDKKNPARINYCLDNRIPVGSRTFYEHLNHFYSHSSLDINALSRMTGRDFSGPLPEFTMAEPVPPAAVQAQESQSEGATEDRPMTTLKSRKRSRSRPLEEGLMVIGDLDTFIDDN
jgi:transcription factor TFIIIB component B''